MAPASSREPPLRIALAVVRRDGRLLITRRPAGAHLEGLWEFPGGKLQPGEDPAEGAVREVREETGIECRPVRPLPAIAYDYPDRSVELLPILCDWSGGEGALRGVAELRWVLPSELAAYLFPPANAPLLELLRAA